MKSPWCSQSLSAAVSLQGLSHYLEHMLFMGSKKYPNENEYDQYLQQHGGSSNAYTDLVRAHIFRQMCFSCGGLALGACEILWIEGQSQLPC